jgi:hypothetical protein
MGALLRLENKKGSQIIIFFGAGIEPAPIVNLLIISTSYFTSFWFATFLQLLTKNTNLNRLRNFSR